MGVRLTCETYFSTYIKKPCSKDLSSCQKLLAVIAAVALTIFTIGLIFLAPYILNKRKIELKIPSNLIDSDIKEAIASMKKRLEELGDISILSAKCILKTDFHSHTEQSNFTLDSKDLSNQLETIEYTHNQQCKRLPFGTPIKTEWAWFITDQENNQHDFIGDFAPPNRGTTLEFGKSGSQVNFHI